jgi:hypothetical protein
MNAILRKLIHTVLLLFPSSRARKSVVNTVVEFLAKVGKIGENMGKAIKQQNPHG